VGAPAVARRVRNAGAIFVGPWAPVSLGTTARGQPRAATGGWPALRRPERARKLSFYFKSRIVSLIMPRIAPSLED